MTTKTISDRTRLLDALWACQEAYGHIRDADVTRLANALGLSEIEIEGVISFYHFFHRRPAGRYTIYLDDSIIAEQHGFRKIRRAFEQTLGVRTGHVDPTGEFGLFTTSCIGLSDQQPACLINFRAFTELTPERVHKVIYALKGGESIDALCDTPRDHIQILPHESKRIFSHPYRAGQALREILDDTPDGVIDHIRDAGLVGMGGAFFPTHIKWKACQGQPETPKYIVCNADEGEPGTFKDRVILQRMPGLLLEGMTIAAYAVGATSGIIYLRAEYRYLLKALQRAIREFRIKGWLGKNILGIRDFEFDIRVQIGAGAYVCGEETAMLQSMEGRRGEPRPRKYFPVERGFLGKPTVVNNVETFCTAARILELGVEHYRNCGTEGSPGTKILSVSGDCHRPGIYEIEWGITVDALLELCGAEDTMAVQMGGPAGELISMEERDRRISLDDLRCGGSVMIYNHKRDLLNILYNYNKFFMRESCGVCTPCRAGNFILSRQLRKFRRGLAEDADMHKIRAWGQTLRFNSRCGLGQTAPNSIIQAIEKFPDYFKGLTKSNGMTMNTLFDLDDAVQEYDHYIKEIQER